jgi:flagellar biosynthesis anti-sigma factor FlgM
MRVNQANSAAIQNSETSSAKKSEHLKKAAYENSNVDAASGSKKTDSVNAEISTKARDMAKATQIAKDTPDVREAKIAALREKIQNKKYDVSSSAIADRLVDDHIRMSGA